MSQKRIYLSPPHMNRTEIDYVRETFESNWIAPLGPNVDAFERDIADYVGVGHSAALSSGTAGIHLALKYLGVRQNDYVFCSAFTFSGSCNPILYEKAIPVFIDSEPESWNMSARALERAFIRARETASLPKAVIIVNLYGQSADWDRLLPICGYYGVPVIEDAAESLGATYRGRQTGSFGKLGIFSFNGNKIITTSGGGMAVSDDETAVQKLRFWATQSREPARYYEHREVGYNYRMSNICAGVGRGQMCTLGQRIEAKRAVYCRYKEELRDYPVEMMPLLEKGTPNYWLSVMTLNSGCGVSPEQIILSLEEENIEARPVWKPMQLQPIFKGYPSFDHSDEKNTSADLFTRGICLPSGSAMSESELDMVIECIKRNFS